MSEISFFEINTTAFTVLNTIQEINLHISNDFAMAKSPEESKMSCMLDENVLKSVLAESCSTDDDLSVSRREVHISPCQSLSDMDEDKENNCP